MSKVIAVCTSGKKGIQKSNKESATFIQDWGIEGDAHAGKYSRQVSLVSADKVEKFREKAKGLGFSEDEIPFGAFGENLAVYGIDFKKLPIGTIFHCNGVALELTQIGKECHGCSILKKMGACIFPTEGIFAKVIKGGIISVGDEMTYTLPFKAAVITVSDSCSKKERIDESGPSLVSLLEQNGFSVTETSIVADSKKAIEKELYRLSDKKDPIHLICTTGGTGFSKRDVTPEATLCVIERQTPGIPEAMRAFSMQITQKSMLSRACAGIRKESLIINFPGSPKACKECFESILEPLSHGLSILAGTAQNCARR